MLARPARLLSSARFPAPRRNRASRNRDTLSPLYLKRHTTNLIMLFPHRGDSEVKRRASELRRAQRADESSHLSVRLRDIAIVLGGLAALAVILTFALSIPSEISGLSRPAASPTSVVHQEHPIPLNCADPTQPGQLSVSVAVRNVGDHCWYPTIEVSPGQTVQWAVEVTNNSNSVQHDIVVSTLVPPHLMVVGGSTQWYNAAITGTALDWDQLATNEGAGGYDFGAYAPNGGGLVIRFDTVAGGGFTPCTVTVRLIAESRSSEAPTPQSAYADVVITRPGCQAGGAQGT